VVAVNGSGGGSGVGEQIWCWRRKPPQRRRQACEPHKPNLTMAAPDKEEREGLCRKRDESRLSPNCRSNRIRRSLMGDGRDEGNETDLNKMRVMSVVAGT
jgi:hypothetical protein